MSVPEVFLVQMLPLMMVEKVIKCPNSSESAEMNVFDRDYTYYYSHSSH